MAVGEAGSGAAVRRVNRWGRKVALGSETWVVIRAWDLGADESCHARPSVIRAEIGRWCRDRWHWPAVLEMYREAYRVDAPVGRLDERADWLERRVAEAFQNEILVLVQPMWEGAGGFAEPSDGASKDLEDSKSRGRGDQQGQNRSLLVPKKTWVEIKLVDQDGAVVPNERYRVTLPDGTIKEGRLDEDGWMRESGIDPGQCTITFPDIHQEEWDPL
jgi:hypothetical protein